MRLRLRGREVWWANLPAPWGRRPVLLLARDQAHAILTWVMVALLNTTIRHNPSTVPLDPAADGVPRRCVVSLDNVQAVRKEWLDSLIVPLRSSKMAAADRAIHFPLALRS